MTVHPDDWWRPWTWDWPHIMASVWTNFFVPCIYGVSKGYITAFAGKAATNVLFYTMVKTTRVMEFSPEGLAVTAVSGCLYGILGH